MANSKKIFKLVTGALALSLAVLLVPLSSAFGEGGFRAGNIISDANMYQATPSMSQAEIQKFLDTQGASCKGNDCLKNLRFDTKTIEADSYCPGTYQGATNEPVSQIIYKVSLACQINPKVLLVTIQKEQSGLTRNLTDASQRTLMGYGCPDDKPCNELYYGVQNQIYRAARQFQLYRVNPTDYAHQAGRTSRIKYHPNDDCGASDVTIDNQATASLYNYTPLQPNPALLSGNSDTCSSNGNYNFYTMYSKWFGDPRSSAPSAPTNNQVPVPPGGNTGSASNTKQQAAQEEGKNNPATSNNSQNQQTTDVAKSAGVGNATSASSTVDSGSPTSTNGSATSNKATTGNAPAPAPQSEAKGAQNTVAKASTQSSNSQSTAVNSASQPQKVLPAKQETATSSQGGSPGLASTGTVGGSVVILAIALVVAGWRIRKNVIDNRPIRVNC